MSRSDSDYFLSYIVVEISLTKCEETDKNIYKEE